MLYPLSYRGNGNYCTTKWDLGRSLVWGPREGLGTVLFLEKLAPYPCSPCGHGLQWLNGRADCAFLGRGTGSAMICWRRPWRDSDSPSW